MVLLGQHCAIGCFSSPSSNLAQRMRINRVQCARERLYNVHHIHIVSRVLIRTITANANAGRFTGTHCVARDARVTVSSYYVMCAVRRDSIRFAIH